MDRKLIIVSAPAGYGKSSLLVDFVHDTDLPVCWFTLDTFDQDLRIFSEYLVASIALRFPGFGSRIRQYLHETTNLGSNVYPLVATLVQEITETIPEYFVIVVEDHHKVENQEPINQFLDLLISYLDENCRIMLTSRTLPALPNLSLLIARRQAAGLSIDELRFTPQEIKRLASKNYRISLDAQQVKSLAVQTGGWITGLLLKAAPYWEKGQAQVPGQEQINLGLYDYLSKQVLDQQPEALKKFLFESSVLEDLTPSVCAEVLEDDQAGARINDLRQRNLFVTEIGEEGRLRYDDLLKDFLITYFRRQDEIRFRQLTWRAAQVYANRQEWERAVSRYLALQDYAAVAGLIIRLSQEYQETGRWTTLASWIDALPDEVLQQSPGILVDRAKIYAEKGDQRQALALLENAEKLYASQSAMLDVARVLVTRASIYRFQGRYAEAVTYCQRALSLAVQSQGKDRSINAMAYKNMGMSWMRMGQTKRGREALIQALEAFIELNDVQDIGLAYHDLGVSYEMTGEISQSIASYQAALRSWQQLGNLSPWANTLNGLGVIYYLQGNYSQAQAYFDDALVKSRQAGDPRVEAYILSSQGDLYCDLQAYDQAYAAYQHAFELANRSNVGFLLTYAMQGLGNTARLSGDLVKAHVYLVKARALAEDHNSSYEKGLCQLMQGILARDERNLTLAQTLFCTAIDILDAGGFKQLLCRAYLGRASAYFQTNDFANALQDLETALNLLAELDYDQFFVVDAREIRPVLEFGLVNGLPGSSLAGLLHRAALQHPDRAAVSMHNSIDVASPQIRILALGNPEVQVDGRVVHWAVIKSRDLFFYLVENKQGVRKEQLGAIFWPDHSPARLESAFRSTLYRLRRDVLKDCILFDNGLYQFNWQANVWYDVQAFESLLRETEMATDPDEKITWFQEGLACYRGSYLQGIYGSWCVIERERLRRKYLEAQFALAGLFATSRKYSQAIGLYQQILSEDPFYEPVHREMMRCYAQTGDRTAAIQDFLTFSRRLWDELGLRPEAETETLYLQIIG
jgi:ATP/maltotriose-dependent transcriptional regulator MalT/DNA-binding SARP family transcriptional activator